MAPGGSHRRGTGGLPYEAPPRLWGHPARAAGGSERRRPPQLLSPWRRPTQPSRRSSGTNFRLVNPV